MPQEEIGKMLRPGDILLLPGHGVWVLHPAGRHKFGPPIVTLENWE